MPRLLQRLIADDPGRPRLTWYGPDDERIELSAATLANWVAKTANLLVEELQAGPGTAIGVSLPAHWRTVTWLLAIWSAGAHAVVIPPAADVAVLVTERPDSGVSQVSARSGAQLVVVSLPALATRFGAPLPPGAVDAAAEVRGMGDRFVPGPVNGASPALTTGTATVSHAGLTQGLDRPPGIRLLTSAGPDHAREAYLAPLLAGGSIVLHAGQTPEQEQKITAQEGTTASYP